MAQGQIFIAQTDPCTICRQKFAFYTCTPGTFVIGVAPRVFCQELFNLSCLTLGSHLALRPGTVLTIYKLLPGHLHEAHTFNGEMYS